MGVLQKLQNKLQTFYTYWACGLLNLLTNEPNCDSRENIKERNVGVKSANLVAEGDFVCMSPFPTTESKAMPPSVMR